jgi:hypothetical protein
VSLAAMPNRFGGKINYREQDYVFELARSLRNYLRKGKRPPITGGIVSRKMPGSKRIPPGGFVSGFATHFDEMADLVGWDLRDPRGRSARVFAPPARRRMRRQKEWYEKEENRRKIRAALAAIAVPGLLGGGALIGRRYFPIKPKINLRPGETRRIVPLSRAFNPRCDKRVDMARVRGYLSGKIIPYCEFNTLRSYRELSTQRKVKTMDPDEYPVPLDEVRALALRLKKRLGLVDS